MDNAYDAYKENFWGILFSAEQGQKLIINAPANGFSLTVWNNVLNIMSTFGCGRTAIFVNDCSYIRADETEIYIEVLPGSASYMKELSSQWPLNKREIEILQIKKLW